VFCSDVLLQSCEKLYLLLRNCPSVFFFAYCDTEASPHAIQKSATISEPKYQRARIEKIGVSCARSDPQVVEEWE
jgi:hypothetical protein